MSTEKTWPSHLSNEVIDIALKELNEDEETRKMSLKEFQKWIKTRANIKHCRLDSNFLLRFLRMQKFDLEATQDIFEKYLTMRCQYPSWFQNLDCKDTALTELVDRGYIIVLPNRDRHGRRIIFSQAGTMDPNRFTASDIMRAHIMTFETLLEDEENQIRGFTYIFDEKSVSWSHLSIWTPSEVSKAFNCCERALPMRHQEIHFLNLPWTMTLIFQFAKSLLSEKIRNRFQTHTSIESLAGVVDSKVLPAEYGGSIPMVECIASWKKELETHRQTLLQLDSFKIDLIGDHPSVIRKKSRHDSGCGMLEMVGNVRKHEMKTE